MSHDTDKLIRQLSLVAFLMAERRPLTARDVKQNVEGYSEMSDEAFARRFYSDRTELLALGVPLHSQRDEFTGEELYTLRSEQYFLPPLELTDDELAALQTCLYLLEGQFAYAEPLRLALQNLALGRPAPAEAVTEGAVRVNVLGSDYSPEMPGRLTKLEGAISKQRTVKFNYWTIGRDETAERTVNPYALFSDNGAWYVVGLDLDRGGERMFRVSRIRGDLRFATRRERDFRAPEDFDPSVFRGRPPWQIGDAVGEARVEVAPDTAWWIERAFADRGELDDGVFTTAYSDLGQLASWTLRQEGRARALEPRELVREVNRSLQLVAQRHRGAPFEPAAEAPLEDDPELPERPAAPLAPERFAVLQALLAYLLARCGDEPRVDVPAAELEERFRLDREQLDEHISLLNLVNFGGGCYAIYAKLTGDNVHVEKELFGDTFRRPPRLTPLEARAIRLALEFVGPMIAAEAHTPLERVRRKLEETFGQFELRETPEPVAGSEEEKLIRALSDAIGKRRLVEIEYLPVGEEMSERVVEPYSLERRLPYWYVHTWDRTRDGERSFRLDRMRRADVLKERFEPRAGFDPRELTDVRSARIWFSPEVARWRLERGAARLLVDGAALEEAPFGSADWLVGEVLSYRGEAVVLSPDDLRKRVAKRASELRRELKTPAKSR
ncbi:MAG: WYL domain-containing protein [Actinomycetota bacterium]|nr:WYL domain-containing protein [Actinomycetota bacterium]